MQTTYLGVVFALGVAAGCSATDPSPPLGSNGDGNNPPASTGGTPPPSESGQTGSIEPAECLDDSACQAFAEDFVARYRQPAESSRHFEGASCIKFGIAAGDDSRSGAACSCKIAGTNGSIRVGPDSLIPCGAYGRIGCLYPGTEFPGCEIASPSTECEAICADVESRFAEDASRSFDASVRLARCSEDYRCDIILKIDDGCYADFLPTTVQRYDCSLSDDAIIADSRSTP